MKEKRLKIIIEGRINSKEMGDVKGGCDCGCEPNPCESLKAYLIKPIDPTYPCVRYGTGIPIGDLHPVCIPNYCPNVMCGNDPKPILVDK